MTDCVLHFSDLCPCGSGRIVADCCLTARCVTTPKLPQTGYVNSHCYARALADCNETLSHEHYISETVLQQISVSGMISVSGLPRMPVGELREIPAHVLAAKVLCQRHNEALSSLDVLAGRFFQFADDQTTHQALMLMNGDDLERWMLKALCGYATSKGISFGSERLLDWCPPTQWLQILFGSEPIPSDCGLYYIASAGCRLRVAGSGIKINAIGNSESGAVGLILLVAGLPFLFSMEPNLAVLQISTGLELWHRPRGVRIRSVQKSIRDIQFGWLTGRDIVVDMIPQPAC